MATHTFAFYGSLRRGMENYSAYEDELEYLFSARLKGYRLHSLGEYPFAVRTSDDDAITVEVFQTTSESAASGIHQLEIDAGYECEEISIDGLKVKIYLYRDHGNYREVDGGDWVTFFRERGSKA